MSDKLREIREVVDEHFGNVRYYSDSHHMKDRWATMAMEKIHDILNRPDRATTEPEEARDE